MALYAYYELLVPSTGRSYGSHTRLSPDASGCLLEAHSCLGGVNAVTHALRTFSDIIQNRGVSFVLGRALAANDQEVLITQFVALRL